jgi:hypothetical protein
MVIVTGAPPALAGADEAGADDDAAADGADDVAAGAGALELAAALGLDDEQPAMTTDVTINALSVTIWPLGRL